MAVDLIDPRPDLRAATPRQKDAFVRDGYLVIPGVLSRAENDTITEAMDRIHRRENLESASPDPTKCRSSRKARSSST